MYQAMFVFSDKAFKKVIKVKSGHLDRSYSSLTDFPIKGSLATEIRYAHKEGCAKMKEERDYHLQTRREAQEKPNCR